MLPFPWVLPQMLVIITKVIIYFQYTALSGTTHSEGPKTPRKLPLLKHNTFWKTLQNGFIVRKFPIVVCSDCILPPIPSGCCQNDCSCYPGMQSRHKKARLVSQPRLVTLATHANGINIHNACMKTESEYGWRDTCRELKKKHIILRDSLSMKMVLFWNEERLAYYKNGR